MGSVARSTKSSVSSPRRRPPARARKRYVVCVSNEGHAASLDVRKIYAVIEDVGAEARGLMRIVDESGEDYLYPKAWFAALDLPAKVKRALTLA
jgi:hypothetical protein